MKKIIIITAMVVLLSFAFVGCEVNPPIDEKIYYTVTFFDSEDQLITSVAVEKGQQATAPAAPIKEGYTFSGWDTAFDNVQSNLSIKAMYTQDNVPVTYTVRFLNHDNEVILSVTVAPGATVNAPDAPLRTGYTFLSWDTELTNVQSNLDIKPIYEVIYTYYTVTFKDHDGSIIDTQTIREGFHATAPIEPTKLGYTFLGWDQDFAFIWGDLEVNALYQINQDPNMKIQYTSYVSSLQYPSMYPTSLLSSQIDYSTSLLTTITNIISGGFRGADQMHYYDAVNYRDRNVYGYEVAVDSSGIVIEKGVLVALPAGGFILSGHTSTATFLQNTIQMGDYIIYRPSQATATVYRDPNVSSIIGLGITINEKVARVSNLYNSQLVPLNYVEIVSRLSQAIQTYNELAVEYDFAKETQAKNLLLDVDFLMVEVSPVQVKSFWHYPLRSGSYSESNITQVRVLLNQISLMGFNRVYLNTNFGGYSVYKSDYLIQSLTAFNTYTGYKDYLEAFIGEAHKRGIEVYAWTNTLIAGDGFLPSFYSQRGWATLSYQGSTSFGGMHFLDISNPEVQVFLENVYRELATNYELDGIEYDFIRFPNTNLHTFTGEITTPSSINDSGYTPTFIDAFMEAEHLSGDFKTLIRTSKEVRTAWLAFKMQTLTDTVQMLSTTIKTARPGISISAAVMPNPSTARTTYLQNWDYWISQGWVDELEPMIYSGSLSYVQSTLATMMGVVGDRALINAGIFPENDGGTAGMSALQIDAINKLYANGWTRFSSKTIFNNPALTSSMTLMARHYGAIPSASDDVIAKAYLRDLIDKVEYFYQLKDTSFQYGTLLALAEAGLELDETADYDIVINQIQTQINNITNITIKTRLLAQMNHIKTMLG
jgi:uncharacterized lipoprotein YddW (UPF0748 family)